MKKVRRILVAGAKGSCLIAVAVALGAVAAPQAIGAASQDAYSGWGDYEGNPEGSKYSSLTQINRSNVSQLQVAWTYETGGTTNAQPLLFDGRLIVAASDGSVVALDPESGQEIWRTRKVVGGGRMRGFTTWQSKDGSDKRIIFPSFQKLIALDVRTGKVVPGFSADLTEGLSRFGEKVERAQSGSPPRVFEDILIVGSAPGEDFEAPPGDIRAFSAITGKLVWQFHTIPRPGEFGYDTWPKDAWKTVGGANDWGGLTLDRKRGIAFVVTGSPSFHFYGGERHGDNLFGNSIIALDARTGKRLWHFQAVHHDLWDYDNANGPTLLTVRQNGKPVDAVALATKSGLLFVFNRVTGKPLFPIEERPVGQTDVPGEQSSPTQPFPKKIPPFIRISITEADLDPMLPPAEKAYWAKLIREARNEGLYTAPSLRNTISMPGSQGGANVAMSAAEPNSGRYYIYAHEIPAILKMSTATDDKFVLQAEIAGGHGAGVYVQHCQLCHLAEREGAPPAIPSLVGIGSRMSDAELREKIREGKAPMPSFASLPAADFDAVVEYLKSDGKSSGPAVAARGTLPPSEGNGPAPGAFGPGGRGGRPPVASVNGNLPSPRGAPRYRSGDGFTMSKMGQSILAPPWQTVTAYDLNKGDKLWSVPLGGTEGRPNTGMAMSKGGIAVTAGGLVFAASAGDRTAYAFDRDTGKVVWQQKLPSVPDGLPSIYESGGRQFIVWSAANYSPRPSLGTTKPPEPGVNSYVAFALPKQ
jgi:quinoprotein glucose dehydrogenase